jgi:hypothetical protein
MIVEKKKLNKSDAFISVTIESFDGLPQGIQISKNPKDYVEKIRQKEIDDRKDPPYVGPIMIKPITIKPNDISGLIKSKWKLIR